MKGVKAVFFETNIGKGKKENPPWRRYAGKLITSSNYFVDLVKKSFGKSQFQ